MEFRRTSEYIDPTASPQTYYTTGRHAASDRKRIATVSIVIQ
jgi:hypothetical protein